jgi:hypothetical protein
MNQREESLRWSTMANARRHRSADRRVRVCWRGRAPARADMAVRAPIERPCHVAETRRQRRSASHRPSRAGFKPLMVANLSLIPNLLKPLINEVQRKIGGPMFPVWPGGSGPLSRFELRGTVENGPRAVPARSTWEHPGQHSKCRLTSDGSPARCDSALLPEKGQPTNKENRRTSE